MSPLRAAAAAATVLALLALAACSDDSNDAADANASATPSTTCPTPVTTTAPGAQQTIQSGGVPRTYNVWLPIGYTGTEPVPVLLDHHGALGEAVSYATNFSAMATRGTERGYLVVAPQAIGENESAVGWSTTPAETPDDVAFVSDVLRSVSSTYCVDPSRLYLTGFSSGAGFTDYASCRLDVWAAVAPVAGVNLAQPCRDAAPVPLVTLHGTDDSFVAYESDTPVTFPGEPDRFYLGDVERVVAEWAVRNGCQPAPLDTPTVPTVTKRTFAGCALGQDVVLFTIEGHGHTYPGGPAVDRGGEPQSQAVDGAKEILDFFDAHVRATPADLNATVSIPPQPSGSTAPTPLPVPTAAVPSTAVPVPTVTG
jgi:polyhydroxybutyrate depolymerase